MGSLEGNLQAVADMIVSSPVSVVSVFQVFLELCSDVRLSVDPVGRIGREDNYTGFVGDLLLEYAAVPRRIYPPLELPERKHDRAIPASL